MKANVLNLALSALLLSVTASAASPTNSLPKSYLEIKNVPYECKNDKVLGRDNCNDGMKKIIDSVKAGLSNYTYQYYNGQLVDSITGEISPMAKPTCNMNGGETSANQLGHPCGTLFEFVVQTSITPPKASVDVKGNPPQYGQLESSWAQGAFIQALNFYKEQVLSEFKNKSVSLVMYEDIPACGAQAMDLMKIIARRDSAEKRIVDSSKGKAPSELSCKQKDGSVGDQALCLQENVNGNLTYLWDLFLRCEITRRVAKNAIELAEKRQQIMDEVRAIAKECGKQAMCVTCSDNDRSNRLNSCYKAKVPDFMKNKFNSWWPLKEPCEKAIAPKDGAGGAGSTSQNNPFSGLGLFAFATLGGFFRKKKRYVQMATTFVGIVACLTAFNAIQPVIGAACGGCSTAGGCKGCSSCANCKCSAESCMACAGKQDTTSTNPNTPGLEDPSNDNGGGMGTGLLAGTGNAPMLSHQADSAQDEIDKLKPVQPNMGSESAATAGEKMDDSGMGDRFGAEGDKGTGMGGIAGAGGIVDKGVGSGASGSGAGSGSKVGLGDTAGSGMESAATAGKGADTGAGMGYEGSNSGGGGGKGGGAKFGSVGPMTSGGVSALNMAGKTTGEVSTAGGLITDADFEALLTKNANDSIFEIVNRRMDKWGKDEVSAKAKAEFKNIK